MASKGWIKLEREIIDHWVFQDAEYFRAWVLILMMANHEQAKILINKELITIPRGAFHSSIAILSQKLGWSKPRTLRYIKMLEMDEMLRTVRTAHGTTFFVENWAKYQSQRTTDVTADNTADITSPITQTRKKKNEKNGESGSRAWKSYDEKVAGMKEAMEKLAEKENE